MSNNNERDFDNHILEAISLPVGKGVLSTTATVPLSTAIDVPAETDKDKWEITTSQEVWASLQLISNRSIIEKHLDIDFGARGVLSGVSLGLNASYSKTIRLSTYSLDVLIVIYVISGSRALREFNLTAKANKILSDSVDDFASAYGDHFCSKEVFGGVFVAKGRYTVDSKVMQSAISGSLGANGISWGVWGDVKAVLKQIQNREIFDFSIATEGVIQDIPNSNQLANPDNFINLCNEWIKRAAQNLTNPIRQYFTPYTSIPGIKPKPRIGEWVNNSLVLLAKQQAQDTLQSILLVETNKDAYEVYDPAKISLAKASTDQFISDCDEQLVNIAKDPLAAIKPPMFSAPSLPDLNRYSIAAIHDHLIKGYKITVTFKETVRTPSLIPLYQGKKYLVFLHAAESKWYCLPPELDDPKPADVTSTNGPTAGVIWMWTVSFIYDNRGLVVQSTSGIQGKIEVVNS